MRRGILFVALLTISVASAIVSPLLGADGDRPTAKQVPAATTPTAKPNFDNVGPQVGDQLPDLKLRTIKGEPQRLADAWRGGPALLVTSSFTCPKSRSRWPELKAVVDKYGAKLNVVIVYVIEAHPVGSVCPYKGVEEVTSENRRDDILRRQPTTLDERLDLAKEFKRYLRVDAPIYVDTLANHAWKAFGAAPNIAFLVDSNGIVAARQGWFEGAAMQKSIDRFLSISKENQKRVELVGREKQAAQDSALEKAGLSIWDLQILARDTKTEKLAEALKKAPGAINLIFPFTEGHHEETTWLMEAVRDRNPAAAEVLLEHGADLKARTHSFDSALEQAAGIGQPEMVKLLLRDHADVNFPAAGRTPLHEALLSAHADIAKILIDGGAKEDFFSDIALGKTDAVGKSLAADPSRALRPDGAGRTPLDYAAVAGQLKIASLLLDNGAPVVVDDLSPTLVPLHYAIQNDHPAMVELLLKAGSSPNTALGYGGEDATSEPPLHMAVASGNVEIVKILLKHKATIERRDTYSETALHDAAGAGNAEIVKLLIGAGANVNARQLGFSLPCGSGNEEIPSQNTPLHFAAASGNPATIKALVDAGAKIDAVNLNGSTPLMSLVEEPLYTSIEEESRLKNTEALLATGANVNLRDKKGRTVLDLATDELNVQKAEKNAPAGRAHGLQDFVDLLEKHGAKHGEPKTGAESQQSDGE